MSIYFDNAATSFPKPEEVCEAMLQYQRELGVSSGRGAYKKALEVDGMVFKTRSLLGRLFNIKDATRIIFTSNVTESLNLALKGLIESGDHVITTHMEHNAVWRPLKVLEEERGLKLTVLSCPEGEKFNPGDLEKAISPETRLVVVNHASNVTGTLMPKEAGGICREKGVPLLVDAAQTAGVYPIDVEELKVDLLAFTGHKGLLGPTGTGGLYIAPGIDLKPLKEGGTGGESILERQPDHLPDKYEAGTPNLVGLAGLGAAVRYILDRGLENIRRHERELTQRALETFPQVPALTLYGPSSAEERVAVLSFNLGGLPPEEVSYVLDEAYHIMVRAGLHCAPQAHRCLGTVDRGTVRIGLGIFNTEEELEYLTKALKEIAVQAKS